MADRGSGVDLRVWGKCRGLGKPYPLLWHLVDTAAVAAALWDSYLTPGQRRVIASGLGVNEEHAKRLVMFWAALHDIGKATPPFQHRPDVPYRPLDDDPVYADIGQPGELPHDHATQLSLMDLLPDHGYRDVGASDGKVCSLVSQVLGGHHGTFCQLRVRRGRVQDPGRRQLGGGGWSDQRAVLVRVLADAFEHPRPPGQLRVPVLALVTGVVVLADWLASQEHFLRARLPEVPTATDPVTVADVRSRLATLRPYVEELLTEAGLGRPRLRGGEFTDMFPFPPNALQRSLIDGLLPHVTGPGLLAVTAAPGDGKTETAYWAALTFAEHAGACGLYFALPTMATADENYRRTRAFVRTVADGPAPVTLLHSMAWLTEAHQAQADARLGDPTSVTTTDEHAAVDVPDWLRGRRRGLLAPFGSGTIDQALLGVLPTRYNVLRLLGLTGKVLVVDEAHAYDEYTRRLLCTLVSWLGAFHTPVILLSATIPGSRIRQLAAAYQEGAGVASPVEPRVEYPGWTFVPADDRPGISIPPAARAEIATGRTVDLRLDVRPVRHLPGIGRQPADRAAAAAPAAVVAPVDPAVTVEQAGPVDRYEVLRDCLAPLLHQGGSAGVVCNTVADAQATFETLRHLAGDRAEIRLLHSRFPARQREQTAGELATRLGRDRHDRADLRMIVVATQVIEQSLDLDFDLVISDLAPMAQLLQRAGRCQRHRYPRPAWARQPRLVVLDPRDADGGHRRPDHWGEVYPPYLLRATHLRLAGLTRIAVPHDVQEHMETVYGEPTGDDPVLRREYQRYVGANHAKGGGATIALIPEPHLLTDLSALSHRVDEQALVTRLGTPSVRVVCCYRYGDGGWWLDPRRTTPLPVEGTGGGRLDAAQVRDILARSIPVPEHYLTGYRPPVETPAAWRDNHWLRGLRPLWFTAGPGGPEPVRTSTRRIHLDPDLGLVVENFPP